MKLVKLNDDFYLLNDDMSRMAMDLPVGTLVFCLSETHMKDPDECIRKSAIEDHCYGCQPLIASTTQIEGASLLGFQNVETLLRHYVCEEDTKKYSIARKVFAADKTFSEKDLDKIMFGYGVGNSSTDNKFTIHEMEASFKAGIEAIKDLQSEEPYHTLEVDYYKSFIKSVAREKTEWEVEVEMEKVLFDPNRPVPYNSDKPKITGGYINIIKII